MDIDTETSTNVEIEDAPAWIATLVRGLRYDLCGEVFEVDVPRPCFNHQKDHLEEHAIIVVPTPGWDADFDEEVDKTTVVAMFDFKPNDRSADGNATVRGQPSTDRLRAFDEAESRRLKRLAEKNTGLADYTKPAQVDAARSRAMPSRRPVASGKQEDSK